MKRVTTFMCTLAVAIFMGSNAKAQDLTSLGGSNYYLIWLDADTELENGISTKVVQDLRVNWDETNNPNGEKAMYIWENTYVANPVSGKGSLGQIGGYLDLSVATGAGWSGLGFCMRANAEGVTTSFPVDLTAITDDYHFHMAVKSSMTKASQIQVFGSETGAAKFSVGTGMVEGAPNITPDFKSDGTWNVIDITVARLKELGFTNRASFIGNYFVILSGAPANNVAVDAVYFYNPTPNGINDVKADKLNVLVTKQIVEVQNATAPIEVYSATGALVKTSVKPIFGVNELAKGAYIIKSGSAVAKVIIK